MTRWKRVLLALVLAVTGALDAMPADAAPRLDMAGDAPRVRVQLEGRLSEPVWFALAGPDRLVIDLPGGRTARGSADGRGLVRGLRLAQFSADSARLVIDLSGPARVSAISTEAGAVTLTLAPATPAEFAALAKAGRPPARRAEPALAALPRPLVVIDPGHGGHDVGAISVFEGRHEKELTLAVSRRIARELEAGGQVRVMLTRSDDRFIPLHERVAMARRAGAALFLSVHGDSAANPEASGATVYTLSDVASDRLAERAAARENRAGLVAGMTLEGEEPEVAGLLFALVQRGTMNASADFAQLLQRSMEPGVRFRSEYHRYAGFAVLKTGDMPAVLLETGYLTNNADAAFLWSEAGQGAIAQGVRRAVEAYFPQRLAARGGGGVEGVALSR